MDLPIENGDFPVSYVKLPEGIASKKVKLYPMVSHDLHWPPISSQKKSCRLCPGGHWWITPNNVDLSDLTNV